MTFDQLLRGQIPRARFFYIGVGLFLLKYNLDRIVAAFHGQSWNIVTYWQPDPLLGTLAAASAHAGLFRALALVALPFIAIGLLLTLARLRDAGLPRELALLFFFPYINLFFFALLSALPTHTRSETTTGSTPFLARLIPASTHGAAAAGLVVSVALALAGIFLSTGVLREYGWGLFLGIPFMAGFCAAAILNFHHDRGILQSILVGCTSLVLIGAFLFGLAMEGIICILMAVPIAFPLGMLGAAVAHAIQRKRFPRTQQPGATMSVLLLLLPGLMGAEHAGRLAPELIAVRTEITIVAPPERVWEHVVSFAKLPEPTSDEWLFRTGIAFPQEATIVGSGAGAIRYCTFSTGSFVEPITVWDAPRRLAFDVSAQPAVMHEFAINDQVVPAHVAGHYLRSEKGEFLLETLPDGKTRLIGTTWYRLQFWPTTYWQNWSDYIIHRIHLRVLTHIKALAERSSQ